MVCIPSHRLSARVIILRISSLHLSIYILKVFLDSVYFLVAISDFQLVNLLLGFSDFLFQFQCFCVAFDFLLLFLLLLFSIETSGLLIWTLSYLSSEFWTLKQSSIGLIEWMCSLGVDGVVRGSIFGHLLVDLGIDVRSRFQSHVSLVDISRISASFRISVVSRCEVILRTKHIMLISTSILYLFVISLWVV